MSDIKLVQNCQNGNFDSFWVLYDSYVEKIYKFIYYKTLNKELSEDLTSEVFFNALNKINNLSLDNESSFKSWLYKIAYNKIIDYYRRKKDNSSLKDYLNLWKDNDLWKNFDDKNKLKEVLKYLKTLKKEHKEVIIMRIWDDLSFKEISEINWFSVDNCKQIFCRTIKKINGNITLLFVTIFFII